MLRSRFDDLGEVLVLSGALDRFDAVCIVKAW